MKPRTLTMTPTLLGNALLLAVLAAMAAWLATQQAGAWAWRAPSPAQGLGAGAAVLAWLLLAFGITGQRRRPRLAATDDASTGEGAWGSEAFLVAYASQTGTAERLARQTVQSLASTGQGAKALPLGELDLAAVPAATRVLFVVSTTGEGDAPDAAAAFCRQWMRAPLALPGFGYGLLALGDRDYANFCGFGRRLRQWLQASGAQPLFDPVEVDNGEAGALRHWQHHLALLAGASELPDWQRPQYGRWTLAERRLLNPGSLGEACFHLALRPCDGALDWQAGDVAEVGPRHGADEVAAWLAQSGFDGEETVAADGRRQALAVLLAGSHLPEPASVQGRPVASWAAALAPLPHREYSIASLPADGALHLLVRQMRRADGRLGLGSGWLTQAAPVGAQIALRVRRNANFHAPPDGRPLVLIGNGTGLAGLRALLKARIAAGHAGNWLLFGERQAACDFHYRDEIEAWRREGWLARLDLAWSREGDRAYVQQRLLDAAGTLRQWVDEGAAIYVCGSLAGMAPGVDAALREVLGEATLDALRSGERYRRDVY
ncbi:sulfite reductase subunit alpha [Frateuria defendens]|uniref:sulfite reductase subunit alpha n=1 Tax=Frateuria defendens TaxID=2219559 RepID=UPI00066FBE52|nr:sulfite reductase subunit alpha [Frateuria defendens]